MPERSTADSSQPGNSRSLPEDLPGYFEQLYRSSGEPWVYSESAPELMRHDLVIEQVRTLARSARRRVLDIGCSLGQLTHRLAGLADEIHGVDISPTAVERARERCRQAAAAGGTDPDAFKLQVGSALDLPFDDCAMDVVLICDGLVSWMLSEDERGQALEEAARVTAPGGRVILTEALKPRQIRPFLRQVEGSSLEVVHFRRLHDRLWFSLQRALRPVRDRPPVAAILKSRAFARRVALFSRLAGDRGTKHVCIIARRP